MSDPIPIPAGVLVYDNADATLTLKGSVVDNGDGTLTIG
jgi:hypothetical protein